MSSSDRARSKKRNRKEMKRKRRREQEQIDCYGRSMPSREPIWRRR